MNPFAEVVDPFDLTAREWVIGLQPPAIHSTARRRLFIRGLPSGSYWPAGGLPGPPPGTTSQSRQEQLAQLLESQPIAQLRRPPMIREGSFLFDVLGEFVEARRLDGTDAQDPEEALEESPHHSLCRCIGNSRARVERLPASVEGTALERSAS